MACSSSEPTSGGVIITGAEGMLGRALVQTANQSVFPFGHADLNVSKRDDVLAKQDLISEGWIIHCAALVTVEGVAKEPEYARDVIVAGTQNVIDLAKAAGSRVLYPQSFLTYGDCDTDIPENYPQKPLSLYGELKLEAQSLIQAQCPDSLIVIMAGFFGGEDKDKNFVGKIIPMIRAAIDRGEKTFAVGDRIWQPTWTTDLARGSWALARPGRSGVYQMACEGEASFFTLAEKIVELMGWSDLIAIVPASVEVINKSELGRRPNRAVLSCQRLKDEGLFNMVPWQVALEKYLRHPYFNKFRISNGVNNESAFT